MTECIWLRTRLLVVLAASLVFVCMVALLPALMTPAHADTLSTLAVGVQTHVLWGSQTDEERLRTLDADAALGAGWVRIDLGWCSVEEAGPGQVSAWYLDRADRMVDAARARGMQVLMTLWCTPDWANGGQARNVPPTDVADYARAATFVADHFKGRVAAWEVWNEPNLSSFWSTKDPVTYTKLLQAAYPAFKAGDSGATVVFGAPSHNDVDFIRASYDAGARGHFDVMATHPYQAIADEPPERAHNGEWYWFTSVELVRDLMVQRGDSHLPIWFTEFGWSSHDNDGTEGNWQRGVTEAQQADFTIRALKLARQDYPYVTHAFVYNDRAKSTSDVHQAGYGLTHRDFTPKPAYTALQAHLATPPPPDPDVEPAPDPAPPFTDRDAIPLTHRGNVDSAFDLEVISGFADGTYRPTTSVRRDQMASFIARSLDAAGIELPAPTGERFTDVAAGSVHDDAIHRLGQAGIVQGGAGGLAPTAYGGDQGVRRDQMASFLLRAAAFAAQENLASQTQAFPDVGSTKTHFANVNGAARVGLATGFADGTYKPGAGVRRDQMATFVVRLLDHLHGATD